MLRSLIVFCLACVLFGCSPTSLPDKIPPKTITAPSNSPSVAPSPFTQPQATYNRSPNYNDFPTTSYTLVIPSGVTTEEIKMREQQVKIAKSIEQIEKIRQEAGIATITDFENAKYFRLTSEIQLLQAKQLLQLKQQADNYKDK